MDLFNVLLVSVSRRKLFIRRYRFTHPTRLLSPSDCAELDRFARHLTWTPAVLNQLLMNRGVTRFRSLQELR